MNEGKHLGHFLGFEVVDFVMDVQVLRETQYDECARRVANTHTHTHTHTTHFDRQVLRVVPNNALLGPTAAQPWG